MTKGYALPYIQRRVNDEIGRGQWRPFVAPPCPRCGTPLCDADGNPRWEIQGFLTFVCLGGCPPPTWIRKATLT